MVSEKKQEFTRRICCANPTQMIVILYDMTLCYLEDAEEALKESHPEAFGTAIGRARGCLRELTDSLHLEYDPAPAMLQLYRYCIRRLGASEARGDAVYFGEIRNILEPLRDAYAQLAQDLPAAPVMENTQSVYVGLTYGKRDLKEDLIGAPNRGFRV
ncbi:MAG: flagellar protein FliS [Lachnospiraceae bacterium]|nr:flagellar protein FliS [Lachnospiraceae bacterium]